MTSICLITGSHLSRNPRLVMEASALAEAGYDVIVLGPGLTDALHDKDLEILKKVSWQYKICVDLRRSHVNSVDRMFLRAVRRVSGDAVKLLGIETPDAIGYGVRRARRAARAMQADLFVGHQEFGMWVACKLAAEGRRVAAHFEDWFSRDLLPEAQAVRPLRLLAECEGHLLNHAEYVTTTSHAMASAMAAAYGTTPPNVIYNCFPWSDREYIDGKFKDRADRSTPSLHWVSQTIGMGRGLELLCEALSHVEHPVQLHVRGAYNEQTEEWLRGMFPSRQGHSLFLHGVVPPAELLSRIAEHDIGLALESPDSDSRNYTVTYKTFHYLVAGLAVIATDTKGQAEVAASSHEAIRLCRAGDPMDLAEQINRLVSHPGALAEAKSRALALARERFCWEKQAPVLLDLVENCLRRPASPTVFESKRKTTGADDYVAST